MHAWNRFDVAADHILSLADAWVVVWEFTQRDYLINVSSLSDDRESPRRDRTFLTLAMTLLDQVVAEVQKEPNAPEDLFDY
jgi:hypothetical protein